MEKIAQIGSVCFLITSFTVPTSTILDINQHLVQGFKNAMPVSAQNCIVWYSNAIVVAKTYLGNAIQC